MLVDTKVQMEWLWLEQVRFNMSILLRNTNAMPFRWSRSTYNCFFCSNSFTDITELRNHCDADHIGFYNPEIVRLAIKKLKQIRVDITKLSCKRCTVAFEDLHILTEHLVETHNIKYHKGLEHYLFQVKLDEDRCKCLVCGADFEFFEHLVVHSVELHEQGTFLCDICGQGFVFYDKFKNHKYRKHTIIRCKYCDKTFTSCTNKKAHEVKYHDAGSYTCKQCSSTFNSFSRLRSHAFSAHNMGTRYTCKKCSKTFLYKKMLQEHVKKVHLKLRQKCPICHAMPMSLKSHLRCHKQEKQYVCDVCQKLFNARRYIVAHLKKHSKIGTIQH